MDIIRRINWFKKTGDDFLVDKEDITYLSVSFLIELLNINVGDDIDMVVGDYLISNEDVFKLQPYIQGLSTELCKFLKGI